ncbi:cytokine-dependent hematopoietic cell linker isoform X1 [Hippoglossus stenolepis]|uniref:cytokine-dependent hematopoietic cell linker isoform X1 n=1 Tax=Hippoglossus stenolepis TaxID=195615 RepID=UPI00159BF742|nr:cytokine-dependent hematopoietic cell linker isoform X1 [Hippoglossus stenolepis]XP_035017584.1 cytokine-dependent hematopoietic cell linker isoform X1 [Hippoglossus stenolepis]
MDRSRNRNQICGDYSDITEPEYAVVDDHEEVMSVCILPARPIYDEMEYADRDLPWSSSAQSLSSLLTGNSSSQPRYPHREIPPTTGPSVNRDLKPGRRKNILDKRFTPGPPGNQLSHRHFPSPPPSSLQLVNQPPGWTHPCRRDRQQKGTKKAVLGSQTIGRQSPETVSGPNNNHRYSLDLETHDLETRSQQNLERGHSGRHHHEWPQTKEDFDQHEFVPKEKPQQTYCEEDWYIGACNRADAEHALHLVNKNGAFLVRDCSINTGSEPLVLSVYHEKKVYNVKIRFFESSSRFALGTGQQSKDMFDSVADIIKFHTIFPIVLISGRNIQGSKYPENCVLTCAVTRMDVNQLLE